MEGLEIRELKLHNDQRGWLGEIFRKDETPFDAQMAYLSLTKPDIVRGPHEHREQTDYFCFMGRFKLYLWDNRETSPTYRAHKIIEIGEKTPMVAIIPPGIVHAYKNVGPADGLVLNLPDRLYGGWGKKDPIDEMRYEDDPQSFFRSEL